MVRVLVACEFSGIVRTAFSALGHEAWSVDLLPTELPGNHYQGDIFDFLKAHPVWDIMIAHPPCRFLAVSGARYFAARQQEQQDALQFVKDLMAVDIPRVAIENPVSVISSKIRKPDQIIQPWQYGHGEQKTTCLWLKNLPRLTPTNIVDGRYGRILALAPSADRWKERSRTYSGIANAMAAQYSKAIIDNLTTVNGKL